MDVSGKDLMEKALDFLRQGKIEEGVRLLRCVVEAQPDRVEAWGHLSAQMTCAGRHEKAIECLEQVLRFAPNNIEAQWRIGDRLVRLNRLSEAEAHYRAALHGEPSCHDARCGLRYVEWLRQKRPQPTTGDGAANAQETSRGEKDDTAFDSGATKRLKPENARQAGEHFVRGDCRLVSLPVHLNIELTTRCNAACTCRKGHETWKGQDLPIEVFEKVERQLLPAAWTVNLTGWGEPLLVRRFDQFYERAARCGTHAHFVTNATTLSISRLEAFARRTTHLSASIDGATRETFEAIRRKTRFDRVIEALRMYKKLRDIYPEVGSTLSIHFVAMRRNIEELPAVVELAAELGAEAIAVTNLATAFLPIEVARECLSHYPDLANRLFDEASERAREKAIEIRVPPKCETPIAPPLSNASGPGKRLNAGRLWPERNRFPQHCSDPWMRAYVSAAGAIHPCCVSTRIMGDLTRQSFAAIWNGRRYRRLRRRINSFLPPLECRTCTILWGMNAGNPSVVRAHEGILVKSFYRIEGLTRRCVRTIRNLLSQIRFL